MQFVDFIKNRITTVVLLLLLSLGLSGQSVNLDSLREALLKTREDTSRVLLINEIVKATYKTSTDSAFYSLRSAIDLAKKQDYTSGLYELYLTLGFVYMHEDQRDSVLHAFEMLNALAIEMKDQQKQSKALQELGKYHNFLNNKKRAINYLQNALRLAEEIDDVPAQIKLNNRLGSVYSYLATYDSSDWYHNRGLDLQRKLENKRIEAGILMNLGNNAARSNDLSKAIDYYEQSNQLMQESGNTKGESIVFQMMGYSCFVMGQYVPAVDYYQKARQRMVAIRDTEGIATCFEASADTYLALEDYSQAVSLYEQAFDFRQAIGSNTRQYDLLLWKGKVFVLKQDYEVALNFLNKSLTLRQAANQFVDDYDLHDQIGICYENLTQVDSAIGYFQTALEIADRANNFLTKTQALINLGRANHSIGKNNLAIAQLEQAMEIAVRIGNKEQDMEAAKLLAKVYENQKKSPQALYYFKRFYELQDTLFNEKNVKEIAFLEAGYEFEKEKQQLAYDRKNEIKEQQFFQNITLFALIVALLFLFTIGWYYRSKQKTNQELSLLNEKLFKQHAIVEEQKDKLEELDEAKSRFFTNISHEFRTPLTVISGMIDQMKAKPDLWLEKGAQMIKQNTLNLLDLVNQILDLRKLESQNMPLNYILGDIIQYLRYVIESYQTYAHSKGLQLHFLTSEASLEMNYDADKLLRIVSNLLSNAIKFTPDGGNIYLQLDQKIQNNTSCLQIRIEDTGLGIPKDQLTQIFNRFYQIDDSSTRKGEGTGIGLALTQALVKLMDGEIEVKSEEGKGTVFTLNLPIRTNASRQGAIPSELNIEDALSTLGAMETAEVVQNTNNSAISKDDRPTLLIVEDNRDVVQFLVACLETDYQLSIAEDGQEGEERAIKSVPDLIVSDVMMPHKDGFEMCANLKQDERTSHIPIILLTAKADIDSKIVGLEHGADAYLTKPFEEKELLVRLKKLLELRKKLQERYGSFLPLDPITSPEDEFIQKVHQVILENLGDEEFGVVSLCRAIAMSRTQVHNKIKALTGKSTSIFIRSIRLRKAQELLSTTNLTVSQITYEVGFKNLNYFSRSFAEEFGVRPSKWRK